MLCSTCQEIDFEAARCCPGDGGAELQVWDSFKESVVQGCAFCKLIWEVHEGSGQEEPIGEALMICNLWNYYEGDSERFRGSASIVISMPGSWDVKIGVYVDEDSPLASANLVSGRQYQLSVQSPECLSLVGSWIEECLRSHGTTCPHELTEMPTRVLDVGGHSSTLRLVITDGLKADWVALSHCWGTTARFVTTKGNIDDYAQHLNLTDLPPTFQDAINVTRTLGYKYLWIDSLCIIQDSHGDWTREAGQMQRYYKHAILTINADSAAGDHEGFLSHARQSDRDAFCIPFKANGLGPCQAYIRKSFRNSLWHEESPLSQRAWTLQEDLLSPRTIHYNAGELNWECQKHRIVESDATPLGTDDAAFSVLNKRHFLKPETAAEDPLVIRYPGFRYHFQPLERWYILFEDYCRREITFNSDRLPAIAGLARELSQQGSLTYMAGLWKEDLHTSLAWSVDSRGESVEKYLAPSWSWASLKINVHWGSNVYPAFELYGKVRNWLPDLELPHAECLDYSLGLEGDDPYGRLRSGRLRLKGRMLSFADWAGKSPTHFNTYWRNVKSHLYWYFRAPGVHPPDALDQMICSLDVDPGFDDEDESYDQLDISPKTEQKKSIEAGEQAQHDPLPQYIEGTLAESVSNASLSDSIQNCETDSVAATWDPSVLNSVYLFQIAIFKPYGNDKNHQSKRLCYALMLKAVDTTPGAFRRVGLAEVPIITGLAEVGWEKSIINIL